MDVLLRNLVLTFVFCLVYLLGNSFQINKQIVKFSMERPTVTYCNSKYAHVLNVSALRRGRRDPVHYFELCAETFIPLDENLHVIINIYEFLSNEYRPSFVTVNFNVCELFNFLDLNITYSKNISEPSKVINMHKELMKPNKKSCLLDPGVYCVQNVTVPVRNIPQSFPFEKGRIYVNLTSKNDYVGSGHLDLELKTVPLIKHKF